MSQHFFRFFECWRRVSVWMVVLAALQLLASAPALACTCLWGASVVWPGDGASVIADSAIVIETRPTYLSPKPYDVTLRGPDGEEIELKELRRLPSPSRVKVTSCSSSQSQGSQQAWNTKSLSRLK